jgi:hypothetical protein
MMQKTAEFDGAFDLWDSMGMSQHRVRQLMLADWAVRASEHTRGLQNRSVPAMRRLRSQGDERIVQ